MPNQIISPRPQGEPQTPRTLTLSLDAIKQLDGLYCLNDLHRLSGGKDKDKPHYFLKLSQTKALIHALENPIIHGKKTYCEQVFKVVNGGEYHGSYGSRKLVYAYAMWIDPYFYGQVLEVFDHVVTATASYAARINSLSQELNAISQCLSMAGRVLAVDGKQTKPSMVKELQSLLEKQQPQLPNLGE